MLRYIGKRLALMIPVLIAVTLLLFIIQAVAPGDPADMGEVAELAESKKLFEKPLHPYTKALLSAVPVPDVDNRQQRIILKGEVTSPINPKPGCRFAARCRYATEICTCESPQPAEYEPGHLVSCHHVRSLPAAFGGLHPLRGGRRRWR